MSVILSGVFSHEFCAVGLVTFIAGQFIQLDISHNCQVFVTSS